MSDTEADALGYLSPKDVVNRFGDARFGPDRLLTVFEEGDMLLCGLSREEIAGMIPSELGAMADRLAEQSTLLLGS
ncbi:hypothetical protein HY949_03385 [Candidatus Gottesmanbacteria bacterium]|nr:hypothetical protein [Candidatus Gottesmanbacteria bacterium]